MRTDEVKANLKAALEAMAAARVTQRELARELGVPQPNVHVTLKEDSYCSEARAERFREAAERLARERLEQLQETIG